MSVEAKLKRYQEEVTEARTQGSKLEGERDSILKRLSEEHDLPGKKEAQEFVDTEKEEQHSLEVGLETILQRIEKKYGFE